MFSLISTWINCWVNNRYAGDLRHHCAHYDVTVIKWLMQKHEFIGKLYQYPKCSHYDDVIMGTIASQITSLTSVYSTVCSGADQRKHQSSASLAFVWGIHRGPVNSPHKWPVTRKMFPFDNVIMRRRLFFSCLGFHIWWHHDMDASCTLLALCEEKPQTTTGFPSQGFSNVDLRYFLFVSLDGPERTV